MNVSIIRFMGPDAVSDSDVWLTAEHIYLNGTGTYEGLEISNSTLHVGDGVSVSGLGILDTQGTTCIVLSGGQTLDIARAEGINVSIRVNAMENWQTGEDLPVTITGNIESRSPEYPPTISLDSGIFILAEGTTLTDVLLNAGGAVIYDYAGLFDENLALLVIHPDDMTPADGAGDVIPVSGAYVTEWPERGRANYYIINELGEDTSIEALSGEDPELFIALHDENGNGLQDLIDAYMDQIVPEDKVLGNGLILAVQVLRMDSDGTLSFEQYILYPNTPLPEEFNADGAVAVRLLFYDAVSFVEPATPGTHTGKTFTGSGILGGYGNNNGNGNGDNGNGNGNGDNGNGNGNGDNGNGNGDNGNGNGDNGNGNGDNGNGNGNGDNGNGNGNGDNGNGNGNGDNGNGNGDNGNGNGNGDNGNGNGDNGNGNGDNGNGDNGNGNGNGDNGNENGENGNENGDNGNGQDGDQDTTSVQTGGVTNPSFWVEQVTAGESYVLHAEEGEKTLRECGGKVKVVIRWELPAEDAGKAVYAVFRNADGTLKAFRVSYSRLKSELSFETDMLGDFTLVAFNFDGEEFSPEFYEALEQIVEI